MFKDTGRFVAFWLMDGASVSSYKQYTSSIKADIMLRDTSGAMWVWYMNGKLVSGAATPPNPGLSWSYVGQNAD